MSQYSTVRYGMYQLNDSKQQLDGWIGRGAVRLQSLDPCLENQKLRVQRCRTG